MLFLFADHRLDTDLRELSSAGTPISLEPQVFDLLVYLVENRERVVSKDDLIASVWGGRIVSDSTLTSRINAARKAIGDTGKDQRLIRTMMRKGFRFVGDVRIDIDTSPAAAPVESRAAEPPAPLPLMEDRPSVAVLSFENLSGDPALLLIVNGLAEDIIALLARVPGFFVIARASSFTYRAGSTDVRRIGAELGVRYVVTGSARASADRVRITVQLIEAETSKQLWAGRYDVERGDTLDLQDEIARRIIVELEPALTRADLQIIRRRRTDSPDAWSHFRQAAGEIAVHGWNEESVTRSLEHLGKAIEIDPHFALAWALRALINAFGANLSLVPYPAKSTRDARSEAERAVSIDPNASDVLGFAGCALSDIGEVIRGHELLQRSVELDPSNAQAHVAYGVSLTRFERFDEGFASIRVGMRSSPRDFRLAFWNMLYAHALARAGRLDEAQQLAETTSRHDGRLYGTRVISAWVLKKLDRPAEAREAIAEARRIRPALSLDEIQRFFGENAAAEISAVWT